MKHRSFDPLDQFPSSWPNAIQEFVSGLGAFQVRIKPGAPGTLQVPAGAGNDQVAIPIEGRWRYVTANVERAGSGAARDVDVYVTATDNVFTAGFPGEVDSTDYSFVLAVVDAATVPSGVAIKRRVAQAQWNGSAFTDVAPIVGGQLTVPGSSGDMKVTARATAPLGWLIANGAAVSRSTYSSLFAAIGTAFGAGDGATTFNLPDLRGRVPMGAGTAAGAHGATAHAVGVVLGEETHRITSAESGVNGNGTTGDDAPDHVHGLGGTALRDSGTFQNWQLPAGAGREIEQFSSTGGASARHRHPFVARDADADHNNLQPSTVVTWLVKT
ncbi:tail protein [Baekduia alba]|uniref:phage tail protein n=1 Tax=Baekduia alba TaxID=2997333 RepID=UPI002341BF59|nr:phage tail protein [Baekduia alba]WCB95493.1 tail protein [Baekduia alba]